MNTFFLFFISKGAKIKMKEIEYMFIRTKSGRILFELRIPRLPLWKRALAKLHFQKDTFKRWEALEAFERFENSNQYRPVMDLINSFRMENKYMGWRKSHLSDKETISFVHELDGSKISF